MLSRSDIDKMYDELFKQTEGFITELHSRQEQQKVEEEEAARMKKLRQGQVKGCLLLMVIAVCEICAWGCCLSGARKTSTDRRGSETEEDSGGVGERTEEEN